MVAVHPCSGMSDANLGTHINSQQHLSPSHPSQPWSHARNALVDVLPYTNTSSSLPDQIRRTLAARSFTPHNRTNFFISCPTNLHTQRRRFLLETYVYKYQILNSLHQTTATALLAQSVERETLKFSRSEKTRLLQYISRLWVRLVLYSSVGSFEPHANQSQTPM